jgi:hypothetical protein
MSLVGTAEFATTYDAAIVAAVGIAQKEVVRHGVQYVCSLRDHEEFSS